MAGSGRLDIAQLLAQQQGGPGFELRQPTDVQKMVLLLNNINNLLDLLFQYLIQKDLGEKTEDIVALLGLNIKKAQVAEDTVEQSESESDGSSLE